MNYMVRIRYQQDVLPPRVYTFHSFKVAWTLFRSIAPFAAHIFLEPI